MSYTIFLITPLTTAEEEKAKPQTLLINCNIFDGKADKLANNRRVLVEGNLIKTIGDADLKGAKHAEVIDCGRRTLLPGLIDAHVHLNMQFGGHGTHRGIHGMQNMTWEIIGALAYESAREYLPAGVTTVRDLCGMSQGLKNHIDTRTPEGPRIYTSGACLGQSSGHGDWR